MKTGGIGVGELRRSAAPAGSKGLEAAVAWLTELGAVGVTPQQERRLLLEEYAASIGEKLWQQKWVMRIELEGTADLAAVEKACMKLVAMHGPLRKVYVQKKRRGAARLESIRRALVTYRPGPPLYRAERRPEARMEVTSQVPSTENVDWTTQDGMDETVARWCEERLDYAAPSLIRATLVVSKEGTGSVLLVVPGLLWGESGVEALGRDLIALYGTNCRNGSGRGAVDAPLGRKAASGVRGPGGVEGTVAGLSHWRRVWAACRDSQVAPADLPTAWPLPPSLPETVPVAHERVRLSEEEVGAVWEVVERLNGDPRPATIAALALVLNRLTARSRIAIAYNRLDDTGLGGESISGACGCLVDVDLLACDNVGALVTQVQEGVVRNRPFEEVPTEALWFALGGCLDLPVRIAQCEVRCHGPIAEQPLRSRGNGWPQSRVLAAPRQGPPGLGVRADFWERRSADLSVAYSPALFAREVVCRMLDDYRDALRMVSMRPKAAVLGHDF